MKGIVKAFILIIFSSSALLAQWEIINNGTIPRILDVDFVSENIGWLVSQTTNEDPFLYKTEDGGETWNTINPILEIGNTSFKYGISINFYNENLGWLVKDFEQDGLDSTKIFKTTDGGNSWAIQKSTNDNLTEIFVLDELNVFFCAYSTIFKTLDGGENWIEISPDITEYSFLNIYFISQDVGIVTGYKYENFSSQDYRLYL